MTAEKTFFHYEDVTVTNARFIVESQTFAMRNITSVKAMEEEPKRFWPIAFIAGGTFALLANILFAITLIVIGIAWLLSQKSMYHVMVTTAGGEKSALKSRQREYVNQVVKAINDAIVERG